MTTADVSLVAKESIVVEKLKNYIPAQFFVLYCTGTGIDAQTRMSHNSFLHSDSNSM